MSLQKVQIGVFCELTEDLIFFCELTEDLSFCELTEDLSFCELTGLFQSACHGFEPTLYGV